MQSPAKTDQHNTTQQYPGHIQLGSRPLLVHEHGPLRFARQHHQHVPDHDEPGYDHYCALRDVTFSNAVKSFETALRDWTPLLRMELENGTLTVHYHSQSKLSQQELADLQKATHFDKKELQQWYKGRRSGSPW
jgi:phosphoribosyl-AMP cyclohydrolase